MSKRHGRLQRITRPRITARLVMLFLAFGILPALLVGGLVLGKQQYFRQIVMQRMEDDALALNDSIDRSVDAQYMDVESYALNAPVDAGRASLVSMMDRYISAQASYRLMLLVAPDGHLLAVNAHDRSGRAVQTASLYDRSFAEEPWFAKALHASDPIMEQPAVSPLVTAANQGDDGYSVVFAAPIKDASGNAVGVWVNVVSFDFVERIVNDLYKRLASSDMSGSEITVLDPSGRVIVDWDPTRADQVGGYHRDFGVIGKLNLVAGNVAAAKAAVAGGQGVVLSMHARKHIMQASGYARAQATGRFPATGWSAMVRVPDTQAFAAINAIMRTIFVVIVLALLVIAGLGWLIGHGVSSPVKALNATMVRLAGGDTTVDVPGTGRQDEIGDMARAVEVFKRNDGERDRLAAAERLETSRREQRAEQLSNLVKAFEGKVGGQVGMLGSAAAQMQSTAGTMAAAATQTRQQAKVVSSAAEKASAGVHTVAAAAEELSASIGEISSRVAESAARTAKAVEHASRTDGIVRNLSDGAKHIEQVVELIASIAGQTNLLALNATIEAARAGDAGRGFAVVASEVKGLANQTSKATSDIAGQIAAIQTATRDAVAAIQEIATTIEEVNSIAASIAAAVEEQGAATAEIARNVHDTATATHAASDNIAGVGETADNTAAASSQVLSAAEGLTRQARDITAEVDAFIRGVRAA